MVKLFAAFVLGMLATLAAMIAGDTGKGVYAGLGAGAVVGVQVIWKLGRSKRVTEAKNNRNARGKSVSVAGGRSHRTRTNASVPVLASGNDTRAGSALGGVADKQPPVTPEVADAISALVNLDVPHSHAEAAISTALRTGTRGLDPLIRAGIQLCRRRAA